MPIHKKSERLQMGLRSEALAFVFGVLVILVTFGDSRLSPSIGNLDTIFGLTFWQPLDVIYPLASIAVFLLYGWAKGERLRINAATVLVFASFLAVLALVNIDDLATALNFLPTESTAYWTVIMWVYPIWAFVAFFFFGKLNQAKRKSAYL